MTLDAISKNYLKDFKSIVARAKSDGSKSVEMASRPIVHEFISKIVENCSSSGINPTVHHDTALSRSDRPDWRIENPGNYGIYCIGDHKNLSLDRNFKLTSSEKNRLIDMLSMVDQFLCSTG